MTFGNNEMAVFFDADGVFVKMVATMEYTILVNVDGEVVSMNITTTAEATLTASGDDVSIEFPDDLDTYVLFAID